MTVTEIRKIIQKRGIETNFKGKKKRDLIHLIQRDEHNFDCYDTDHSGTCGQNLCLWRQDCIKADALKVN